MTTPYGLRPPPQGGNTGGPAEPDPRCSAWFSFGSQRWAVPAPSGRRPPPRGGSAGGPAGAVGRSSAWFSFGSQGWAVWGRARPSWGGDRLTLLGGWGVSSRGGRQHQWTFGSGFVVF